MKFKALLLALSSVTAMTAQVVTTDPPILQEDTKDITIIYHANLGNKALAGQASTAAIYAHTGVITDQSKTDADWKYAPTWLDNDEKYKLTYAGPDTWTLKMESVREYYGVPADETIKKLAFVFRNSTGSLEGKTSSGSDIFVEVYPDGYQTLLSSDASTTVFTKETTVNFTAYATEKSDITLSIESPATTIASVTGAQTLEAPYTFKTPGSYKIKATFTANGKTETQSLDFQYVKSGVEAPYPGSAIKMGAVANADGSVTFCLAAPGKESAMIRGSWNNYGFDDNTSMNYQDVDDVRYFWTTIPGIADGKDYIYFYNVDGETSVGDPYANLVLDPFNDRYISSSVFPNLPAYPSAYVSGTPVAIYNSTMNDYDWEVTDFKGVPQSQLIIYELLIRDFTGTEGAAKGSGTVQGVISKLDYLKDLGVNAIELLPIMEFNGNNSWGYNTNFYMAPDKAYGTPDDYRMLIDEIHKRGMAVILDIVFNQSDGLHPWYMLYTPATNPFYNAGAPHSYSVLNDWNQDNALVQQQWRDAVQYWLTAYKVDGFRFDLVKGLGDNDSYGATYRPSTNTFTGVTEAKTNAYNASRVARMKEIHDAIREVNPDAYFINENLATAQEENEMAKDGEINWANINYNSCQFAMGYQSDGSLNRFYATLDSRTWGSTVSYAESHDEERMAYKQDKYGASGVKGNVEMSMRRLGSVAAQMLFAPGAHMIWQFQEFGADQTTKNTSGDNNTNPKKVIWSYLDDPDRQGLMRDYQALCHLRSKNPDMFEQGVTTLITFGTWTNGRYASLKKGDRAIYLAVNPVLGKELEVNFGVDLTAEGIQLISASYGTTPEPTTTGVKLASGAYAIYATSNIAGIDSPVLDSDNARHLIYGIEGEIIVEGDHNYVQAYDAAGKAVGLTGLQPGLYIVRADDTVAKVVVK